MSSTACLPGEGSLPEGIEEARELGRRLASEPIELGVSSRLRRASETLAAALAGRDIPCVVDPHFDEIGFGAFEGGSLASYRAWAWEQHPEADCPGGGETRAAAAARFADGLAALLQRPEKVILAVSHGLPSATSSMPRTAFPGAAARAGAARSPASARAGEVERAAETLVAWAAGRGLPQYP